MVLAYLKVCSTVVLLIKSVLRLRVFISILEFPEDSRSDRMLLFQESILARFGFLPCVVEKKFSFNKDVSKNKFCLNNIFNYIVDLGSKGISICSLFGQYVCPYTVGVFFSPLSLVENYKCFVL